MKESGTYRTPTEIHFGDVQSLLTEDDEKNRNALLVIDSSIARSGVVPLAFPAFLVEGGEECKSMEKVQELCQFFLQLNLDRGGRVYVVGGGSITDLAGFACSIWKRGVESIFVPTTLLSMVDACYGGKTSINFGSTKNVIGTFHHPAKILCDLQFLDTLPAREITSGLAEVIKAGVIGDLKLFEKLAKDGFEKENRNEIIHDALKVKIEIVGMDPLEKHDRQLLNLGHTVGHGVELILGEPHGHAVARGMVAESKIAEKLGITSSETTSRIESLLKKFGLPVTLGVDPHQLHDVMLQDKKIRAGKVTLALPEVIGGTILHTMDFEDFYEIVQTLH